MIFFVSMRSREDLMDAMPVGVLAVIGVVVMIAAIYLLRPEKQ